MAVVTLRTEQKEIMPKCAKMCQEVFKIAGSRVLLKSQVQTETVEHNKSGLVSTLEKVASNLSQSSKAYMF